jgi:PAS domain-containing protein
VTAEFEARSALEASEARLRAIIDNSPDIVAVLHPTGHWEASKQASRLLGYDPSDAPTGGPFALLHPDDAPIAAEALREVLSGSRTPMEPIELRLKRPAATGRSSASARTSVLTSKVAASSSPPATSKSASGPSARIGRPKSGSGPRSSTRRCAFPWWISTG